MEPPEPSSSDRIKQTEEICLPSICRENLETIYRKLEELEHQIPPAWTFRMFGMAFSFVLAGLISVETWQVVQIFRTHADIEHLTSRMIDHAALPIHPGAAQDVRQLQSQISELNVQVKILSDRVERYCIRQGTPKTE